MSEKLYNNIELPEVWPPRNIDPNDFQPMRVPYLANPPAVINIDVGRQLFVDDFLLEDNSMVPTHHHPIKYTCNPVFYPETKHERENNGLPPCTLPKCGGIWYDPTDCIFKMWYMCSYTGCMAYATSTDGIHWERPSLDIVPGTNVIISEDFHPDSGSVWLDADSSDPNQRFKFFVREPGGNKPGKMFTSPDGIHWSEPTETGIEGDRSTAFYNPFRHKWVQSIREYLPKRRGRCRRYMEADDFLQSGIWQPGEPPYWMGADLMDHALYSEAQLYNFDAVAYESIMLGLFQILQGPPNGVGERAVQPKLTELNVGYSRDGFHFLRPDRTSFIPARRTPDSWEFGYIEPTAGLALIVGDELWFYYSAYGGAPEYTESSLRNGMYGNGAVGIAKLRRDGMVSLRATFPRAGIITRKLVFTKGTGLFVNANTSGSILSVECLDENNQPIEGFTRDDCLGFRGNSTCAEIRWKNASIATLANRPFKFSFMLNRGDFYSFWIGKDAKGASGGYVAAGGPAYSSNRDI
ncbi:MAG: hypothetical protein J6X55_01350 [Victivallales bacterium]|nr:hypothetical protein [Victivallales bacterium]